MCQNVFSHCLCLSLHLCLKCACFPLPCHMLMFLYVQPSALLVSKDCELTTPTRVQQEVRQEEVRNRIKCHLQSVWVTRPSTSDALNRQHVNDKLQWVSASYDQLLTSVEALPHREVTLVLSPSPCMHVSLLYQARSLEDQLQLQEAANHQHRYGVYWFTLTWPIAITC